MGWSRILRIFSAGVSLLPASSPALTGNVSKSVVAAAVQTIFLKEASMGKLLFRNGSPLSMTWRDILPILPAKKSDASNFRQQKPKSPEDLTHGLDCHPAVTDAGLGPRMTYNRAPANAASSS